jgi:hypothetical protein
VDLAIRNLEAEVEKNPNFWYRKMQLAEWLNVAGRHEEVIEMGRSVFPALYTDAPVVNNGNIWMARSVTEAMLDVGQDDQAMKIIEAGLEHLSMQRKLQGGGIASGTDDVMFLGMRGDITAAVERLREAIDRDWQFYSFGLMFPRAWPEALYNDPRFQEQVERQREKMAEQRAWYAENRERDLLDGY